VCINRLALVLVGALGFLNANDQNEVRLPVVKFLASQRASSIQTSVAYFIAVRLVLINQISLQHCRPVDYVQEPNSEPGSSRRNLLGETDMSSYCGLLIGNLDCKPLSSASRRALWPGGSAFLAAQGSGRLPVRAVQSSPFPPCAARRRGGPGGGLGTPGLAPGPRPPRPHLRKK
jgi:hypothetical protein